MGISVIDEVASSKSKIVEVEYNIGELFRLLKSHQLLDIPDRYVDEEEPIGVVPYADLPVIDISLLKSERHRVVKEVGDAAAKLGFMQVINHGVPLDLIKKHEHLAHKFFNLPREVKEKGLGSSYGGYKGGASPEEFRSKILPWRESFRVNFHPDGMPQRFLDEIFLEIDPTQTDIWTDYENEISKLSRLMHEALAESVGLNKTYFNQFFNYDDETRHRSTVSWNIYPPNPTPKRVFGARGHFDPLSLTFLWQDEVGGLQLKGEHGDWLAVKPMEEALVVNLGDLMQGWTNDKYKSAEHRVVPNANQSRLSIVAFVMPHPQALISAPEEILDEKNPRKYRPFTTQEYIIPNPVTNKYPVGRSKLPAFLV